MKLKEWLPLLVAVLMVLYLAVDAVAHEEPERSPFASAAAMNSAFTFKPAVAYTVFIPADVDIAINARPMGALGLSYIIPITRNGEHNARIGTSGGIGEDMTATGFVLGYAIAPEEAPAIVVGVSFVFQIGWPSEDLRLEAAGFDERNENETLRDEVWLNLGAQADFDFKLTDGFAAGLTLIYTRGVRDAPDQFSFALTLPMQSTGPAETVRRF